MTDFGDVYVADLDEERRRLVMVASPARFAQAAGRVVVVPQILGDPDQVPFPWRVDDDGTVFAVDFMRTIPVGRLLERTGTVSGTTAAQVRRAIRHITT